MKVKQKQIEDFMKQEDTRLKGIGSSLNKQKLQQENLDFSNFLKSKYEDIKEGFFGNLFSSKPQVQQPTQELKDKVLIDKWLKDNNITKYTINGDLSVDVYQDVDLRNKNLYIIPVKFGKVMGHFGIDKNNLQTLKNCPYYVGKSFGCSSNKLTSLVGCPQTVGGTFDADSNKLNNLDMVYNVKVGDTVMLSFNLRDFTLEEVMQKFSLTPKAIQQLKSFMGSPFLTKSGNLGWR